MSDVLVTIRGLAVELGGNPILQGVDCDLRRGQITALIGLNGAGKTTLLRALLKEVPSAGSVRFHCGHDHTKATPEHIGYVPQKLRLDGNLPLTVLDLFGLCLRHPPLFLGLGRRFRRHVEGLLRVVGVESLVDRLIEGLSGGELQRVLLALALEPSPELLLLDEPAAGVDFKMQQSFYDLIGELNARTGVTVLLVSHDLTMVSRVVHHVICLKDGRVGCEGAPREVIRSDVLANIFGADAALFGHHH
jgi:zinc transport system ATP-binding protein